MTMTTAEKLALDAETHGLSLAEAIAAGKFSMSLERYAALKAVSTLDDHRRAERDIARRAEAREEVLRLQAVEAARAELEGGEAA